MTSSGKAAALGLAAALSLSTLAACSTDDEGSSDGTVTIEVAMDVGLDADAIAAFDARIEQFEKANPDIGVEHVEYTWDATTFAAGLAGGTLPDVFPVPFTDGRGLIANEQIADVSALVAELPYADRYNPNVSQAGEDEDGDIWAVPIAAYSQGLHYNRALFTQAGLDPDDPPATWDEVREDAKAIADATGQVGYATMTQSNTGGGILTTLVNAMGGSVEDFDGETATATIDTPEMRTALDYLRTLRWTDNSMGSNFLYDWGGINQAFASGQIGMYVSGGGNYGNLFTQNALDPSVYGLTVLPLEGDDAGVLGGGTLAAVNAKATEAEQAAAVKWIDFYYMQKLFDQDAAVLDAQTSAAADQPVGAPQLPVFDQATYAEQQSWIAEYVNVPLEQMTGYTDHVFEQPLLAEPARSTQDLYAALDPVVQSVLTDQDADIDQLLDAAQTQVQSLLDQG
ncbi:sugar ABC transporter substrate-binding protein [Cellulomonas sp. Root930]|nr:sugar ABC transporter substrate-binding protein [Cellulomonas sp. Root930]